MTERPQAADVAREAGIAACAAYSTATCPDQVTAAVIPIIHRALWQAETAAMEKVTRILSGHPCLFDDSGNPDARAEKFRCELLAKIENVIQPEPQR